VKTDGLAAGKGVFVTPDLDAAIADAKQKLTGESFGAAGRTVVIEEGLVGPELSLLAVCDGERAVPLAPAQDFKRVGDGDAGPNTGGMGAYSPVPIAGPGVVGQVMDRAVEPTLAMLRKLGIDYRGVLYAGLMLTEAGPKVIEFNVRFGDPETQVVLPRLTTSLVDLLAQAGGGRLTDEPAFAPDAAVTVVVASEGYPAAPVTGRPITGIADAEAVEGVTVFHAGTARSDGQLVASGGRVLNVTGVGPTIAAARERAYAGITRISMPGMHYRGDIAERAIGEEASG
jgi:phosphoribosylamine--glycine ligase